MTTIGRGRPARHARIAMRRLSGCITEARAIAPVITAPRHIGARLPTMIAVRTTAGRGIASGMRRPVPAHIATDRLALAPIVNRTANPRRTTAIGTMELRHGSTTAWAIWVHRRRGLLHTATSKTTSVRHRRGTCGTRHRTTKRARTVGTRVMRRHITAIHRPTTVTATAAFGLPAAQTADLRRRRTTTTDVATSGPQARLPGAPATLEGPSLPTSDRR